MKCEECLNSVEEYLNGELAPQSASRVNAHISKCAACAAAYRALEQEQAVYAHYRRDVDVTPTLWAGVQARIAAEKPARPSDRFAWLREHLAALFATPRFSPALAAALVIITVGITVAVMSYVNSKKETAGGETTAVNGDGKSNAPAPAPTPNNVAPPENREEPMKDAPPIIASDKPVTPKRPAVKAPTPEQLVREAEQKYLSAIAILSRDIKIKRNRSELDAATLARFDDALFSIDATLAETRQAVRRNPQDPVALSYMLTAYAKKVDLLREMAREH